jgi:hypothetical protein
MASLYPPGSNVICNLAARIPDIRIVDSINRKTQGLPQRRGEHRGIDLCPLCLCGEVSDYKILVP